MAEAFNGDYGMKICSLNWGHHHSTIISVLDSLLQKESLVDVTLAAEGKFINVHRFMLFACSPYFEVISSTHSFTFFRLNYLRIIILLFFIWQELLNQLPKKQAIIFLKDVTFVNLQAIVNVRIIFLTFIGSILLHLHFIYLQFMYKGEVHIPEEQLLSFLQTAISLKIKGIANLDYGF